MVRTPPMTPSSAVRPKASQRKRRGLPADPPRARQPAQERSVQRHEAILDAARRLLATTDLENVGLADVAAEAGIPASSVHYLFPTTAELFRMLAHRVRDELVARSDRRIGILRRPTWQASLAAGLRDTRDAFCADRAVMELILGPRPHRDLMISDAATNDAIAASIIARLHHEFVMPEIPDLAAKVSTALSLSDALWSRAYVETGTIGDAAFEEATRAAIAYLRSFLPETLFPKPPPSFASKGEHT